MDGLGALIISPTRELVRSLCTSPVHLHLRVTNLSRVYARVPMRMYLYLCPYVYFHLCLVHAYIYARVQRVMSRTGSADLRRPEAGRLPPHALCGPRHRRQRLRLRAQT